MNLIRTAIRFTRTLRSAGRVKEIMVVFARHGLDEFLLQAPLPNFWMKLIPFKRSESLQNEFEIKEKKDWGQIIGSRLKASFEELGPAFVKLGQFLSSRVDLFDASFIEEMKALRDQVKGIPFEEAKKEIEKSLGKKIEEVFESIEENPVGTASIGIVYKATLKTGEVVVIKLRRPEVAKVFAADFQVLTALVLRVEKMSTQAKALGLSRMLKDFSGRIQTELNFNLECLNLERIKNNIKAYDTNNLLYLPKVYKQFCSESLIVMEFLEGISFNRLTSKDITEELTIKMQDAIRIYARTFLQDGFFHADLHEGNFLLLTNGQIGILDFGLVGHLSKKTRKNFIAIIYALVTSNYENLVYEFLDVAEYEAVPDLEALIGDVKETLLPYAGLPVKEIQAGFLLQKTLRILSNHRIYLPREWFIVFRALIIIDGVGKTLKLDKDILALIEDDIKDLAKSSFTKEELIEEALWMGKDLLSSMRMFPRHAKWFMRDFAKKNHAIELINKGYEKELTSVGRSLSFLGHAFLGGIFFFAGTLFLVGKEIHTIHDISHFVFLLWGLSLFFIVLFLFKKRE